MADYKNEQENGELTDEALEAAAGGEGILGDIGTDLVNAIDSIVCSFAAGFRDGMES